MASASGENACSYDVFLSFCGEDTRNGFTDHLYHKLLQAGIRTYRDNEEIHKGGELKPEFETAIQQSRASIVVLSKNYAASTWCLDELLLILQQREECGHYVLPVFYGVEPTQIRKQTGSFDIKVVPSSTKWTDDNVSKWKKALKQVANLAGHVLSGPETIFLKEIVDTMYNELDLKEVHLPLNLIGMATHNKEIRSWLDDPDAPFLVIIGMGGSGKTTLAKYIYTSHKRSFDYVSFIGDVGSKCERHNNDLVEVQEQLLKDILGGKERRIPCVSRGTPMIEDALRTKRALIVLDDVVGETLLVDLLGTGEINAQSKIIITTTENPDSWRDFPHLRCQKYEMRLLNAEESSELLCRHAFQSETPNEGFDKVVLRAIKYCGGNPLALEVLGSSLYKNDSLQFWESQLSSFERDIHARIKNVLLRSYASLPYDTLKGLFLHIACFFNGVDKDYAEKILEPDYSAKSGIKTLINRCLISISPNKKLMMHRLIEDMGKNKVRQESNNPAKRSRVWLSNESYKMLKRGTGSKTVQGLALDMYMLKEEITFKPSQLNTEALNNMDSLKLLQLNSVEINGSFDDISVDLRWLCWLGFHLTTIPSELFIGNLVAIDMSYSKLEAFEPPAVLQCLQILNLKDSHNLSKISNMSNIPHLETLILWNCYSLVNVCEKVGDLTRLDTLNMTGCKKLFNHNGQINLLAASTSSRVVTEQPTFSFSLSLHRLFLKDCNLECTDYFPLSFSDHHYLQYLNLGNSLFESLPRYDHLKNLLILDLSFCSKLQCVTCLPSTLAELYIYGCELLERVTFQSHRFTLQQFGYLGCINLYEVEDFIKLVPVANLDEADLGHMGWLKQYKNLEVCLVGDDELTEGRGWHIQMLYEFKIMSTSLPDMEVPSTSPEYTSKSSFLSFEVPSCPKNKRLIGINVTFKYALSGDDWIWFCKISTANVEDLIYNPKVFGKPESGEACIWLSYWPIGDKLKTGDTVHVSIVEIKGMKVHECGVSLVYSDQDTLENEMVWEEILGDVSGFQLSTGGYYLCRRDFHELMEVNRLGPDWFMVLVGDTIDYTEVRGWRKTGRPNHMNQSFTEVKTIRCIIHGPQFEDIYNIANMTKPSIGDKNVAFTSSFLKGEIKSGTRSDLIDVAMEEIYEKPYVSEIETFGDFETMEESDPHSHEQKESEGMSKVVGSDEIKESDSPPHVVRLKSVVTNESSGQGIKEIVLEVKLNSQTEIRETMKALSVLQGVESIDFNKEEGILTVTGDIDPETLISRVTKVTNIDFSSFGPSSEILEQHERVTSSATGERKKSSSSAPRYPCRLFSFTEIQSATRNFDDGLIRGTGESGTVYKGQVYSEEGGHAVAIKRLSSTSNERDLEFWPEIDTLCRYRRHRHLVTLIGYCDETKEKYLVYEYMPGGSLHDHLHIFHTPLSWATRLKIAIGVARGLKYLHEGVGPYHGVIHCDVKSSHILLDKDWEAVISGFKSSKICPTNKYVKDAVKGTSGYLDPEYSHTGRLKRKTDVYSFGVVLFELISGMPAQRGKDRGSLVKWAKKCVRKEKLDQMVDSNITGMISTECLELFAGIAYCCVRNASKKRPTMTEVLDSLEAVLELHQKQEEPSVKVAFAWKEL